MWVRVIGKEICEEVDGDEKKVAFRDPWLQYSQAFRWKGSGAGNLKARSVAIDMTLVPRLKNPHPRFKI